MSIAVPQMIGRSPVFLRTMSLIERMARYDVPVLIQGETGTGKELAARAIHYLSPLRDGPFVPINCGALPDTLIESELFGCERGAFTDARQARAGMVSAAEGGTLFLDELDALPSHAQVALLRFLQDHRYRPVGGARDRDGHVRIVAAASPRLRELLERGQFRDDLAFRLDVLTLHMPALRDRTGDPQLLAEHFIARHARHHQLSPRTLHADSLAWMARHDWPGNVRELDNLIQRALLLGDEPQLRLGGAASRGPLEDSRAIAPPPAGNLPMPQYASAREHALQHFERQYLERLMLASAGNVSHAARMAGKERRALGKLLKKHGIEKQAADVGDTADEQLRPL